MEKINIILNNLDKEESKIIEEIDNQHKKIIKESYIDINKNLEEWKLDFFSIDEKNKKLNKNIYTEIWKIEFSLDNENKWFNIMFYKFELNWKNIVYKDDIKSIKILFNINQNSESIIDLLYDFFELQIWTEFSDITKNTTNWLYFIWEKKWEDKNIKKFDTLISFIVEQLEAIVTENITNKTFWIWLPIIINNNNSLSDQLFLSAVLWVKDALKYIWESYWYDENVISDSIKNIIEDYKKLNDIKLINEIKILEKKKFNSIINTLKEIDY